MAGDELLQAVRAAIQASQSDDHDDAVLDAEDDVQHGDTLSLCMDALHEAVESHVSINPPTIELLMDDLLAWKVDALELTRSTKATLAALRWRVIMCVLSVSTINYDHHHDHDQQRIDRVLSAMVDDRFASLETQYAIADCLVMCITRGLLQISECALELAKQFYVTLDSLATRESLVDALVQMVSSKENVKQVLHVGLLRSIVQIALLEERSSQLVDDEDADAQETSEDNETTVTSAMQNAIMILHHISTFVCPMTQSHDQRDSQKESDEPRVRGLCSAVVQLMLSRVSLVFDESIRLLQMLVESPSPWVVESLVSIPDLRGALDKAKTIATKPETKPTVKDPYICSLCEQLHVLLVPQIDQYEKHHGSLIGLHAETPSTQEKEDALQTAVDCKARGNLFFQRGNFATARVLYRRAIAIVRAAEFHTEQTLSALSIEERRRKCTIGASVHVLQRNGTYRRAMVCDDVEADDTVEVLYDDSGQEEEEEQVALARIRLRMATSQLEQFKNVTVDCAMNMGKALMMLFDYESAVACFTHALATQPQYIAALYQRGVAQIALHDLQNAQKDLIKANELCIKWKTLGNKQEATKKKRLHSQIVTAYKKLQSLHASKKRVDKNLMKQMLGYLATIPGLQEDEGEEQ